LVDFSTVKTLAFNLFLTTPFFTLAYILQFSGYAHDRFAGFCFLCACFYAEGYLPQIDCVHDSEAEVVE